MPITPTASVASDAAVARSASGDSFWIDVALTGEPIDPSSVAQKVRPMRRASRESTLSATKNTSADEQHGHAPEPLRTMTAAAIKRSASTPPSSMPQPMPTADRETRPGSRHLHGQLVAAHEECGSQAIGPNNVQL